MFGRRFAGDRGDTVGEAFVWAATHPLETVSDIGSQSAVGLVLLLLSTGALALLAPTWLLLAVPSVAYNALSAYESQHDLVHHYHLGTITGLFIAAAVGVARLPSLGPRGRILATVGVASCGSRLAARRAPGPHRARGRGPARGRARLGARSP